MVTEILAEKIVKFPQENFRQHDEFYIYTLEKEINWLEDENTRLEKRIEFYEKIINDRFDPMIIDQYCD